MADKNYKRDYIAKKSNDDPAEQVSFSLVDEKTVKRLTDDGDIELPYKDLDKIKDERWNTKQMSSKLLQGILNGDPVDKIAQSLIGIVSNNEAAAMRNARTMVTGAENRGRLDSYNELDEQGVVQKKVWIATPDDRTRESHLEIDGQEQEIDGKFTNGLEFPGDPSGDPGEVYNCRCTMIDKIIGFRRADGTISYVDAPDDTTLHDQQMNEERERRGLDPIEPEAAPEVEPFDTKLFANSREADEYFRGRAYDSKLGGINKTRGYGIEEDDQKPATKWANKLTYDQTVAVNDYTGAQYEPINNFLRGIWDKKEAEENYYGNTTLKKNIKDLDGAINKFDLKEPLTVYRTCERDFLDKLSVGSVFHDEGFGSTSVLPNSVASGDVHMEILVPKGKGVGAYVDGLSWKEGEEFEFLLGRGADYYVSEIRKEKDGIYVKAIITGFTKEK